jgi:peptide deformylase
LWTTLRPQSCLEAIYVAIRSILTADKPVLHIKAKPVQRVDSSIRKLMADMVDTMHDASGAGLAAPQIGVSLRVIVLWHEDDEFRLVNPEVTWSSREIEVDEEGCLSIPGYRGNVPRHVAIKVRGKDEKGRNVQVRAEGRLARIFQHEIDHLDGILFTQRMAQGDRLWQVDETVEVEEPLAPTGTDAR